MFLRVTAIASVKSVTARLADELSVGEAQVGAAVRLLDEGATVPFIARYRKEATGSLDDGQLRTLEERLGYLRELDDRRAAVLASIEEQGKLTDELRAALMSADTKARVEDIYLPYKPKRRTKAQIAREAGLEPLVDRLLADPTLVPETVAAEFVCEGVADAAAALEGARHILVERTSEDAELVGAIREKFWADGSLRTAPWSEDAAKGAAAQKFRDYFEFSESLGTMPSHRALAVMRGEKEEALALTFDGGEDDAYQAMIAQALGINTASTGAATPWLAASVRWAWRTKLMVSAGIDARIRLRQRAEEEAVAVFAKNLKDLLLAAPAGARTTLGLDPGYRTGVKVAVVDDTGKVVDTCAIYPHQPQKQWDSAKATLAALVARHRVELVAVGNGTASRETDALAAELIADIRAAGADAPVKAIVSEAGASVYSASAYAARELPSLDVTLRGAVSIARRLQDPLAELVKIEPKSIGVGQYQHDVTPGTLARSLTAVVEDAVNAVGVDLNTASVPLLTRVSGVSESLAEAIVAHRDKAGPFRNRSALRDVPRLGPKAFEQCAGFLRIRGGDDPLDSSGVHPEAYPVVRRILDRSDVTLTELIADVRAAGADAPVKAIVSEAGASVYSASAYAARELPSLDVTLRGAVSIARRLQDPLAELVKIEPKSIGVGQYQHDVTPGTLARSLTAVVEDAVNAVGVDLNTASVPLLTRVSGVSESLAEAIVAHRDKAGPFRNRSALRDVPRLGPKAFEQCAGFLRIRGGDDPLDSSGVHPEAYPVVRRILDRSGVTLTELIGNERSLKSLRPADFADDRFGIPTVTDILAELEKPGRDPRPAFSTATFATGVEKVADLKAGMVLEGVVTNVAAFGAFVDVGVHQDGLVHVSAMADRFVSDPHEIVRSGQVVRVKVIDVDVERQRIGLSLRLGDTPQRENKHNDRAGASSRGAGNQPRAGQERKRNRDNNSGRRESSRSSGSMAQALRDAGFGK